jgi:hypothetical protein
VNVLKYKEGVYSGNLTLPEEDRKDGDEAGEESQAAIYWAMAERPGWWIRIRALRNT